MDNLRWILIFAGVAILVLLWWSGRAQRRDVSASREPDPLFGDDPLDVGFDDFDDLDPDDLARPAAAADPATLRTRRPAPLASATASAALDADPPLVRAPTADHGFGALSQKFEAIGERLSPNRRRRVAEAASDAEQSERAERPAASKIVTLHVVAPAGEILPPEALQAVLVQRGYHHGDMDIFHSLYRDETVFSIARMVKPGTFDPDDITSFETPGIALILQLPGPVAADTAFEVMLSEAFEIAAELGGSVLDGNRSTLGRQTEQHLRESIHEYMHRQKYLDSVA